VALTAAPGAGSRLVTWGVLFGLFIGFATDFILVAAGVERSPGARHEPVDGATSCLLARVRRRHAMQVLVRPEGLSRSPAAAFRRHAI
jgi:hypothetical protein